MPQTPTVQGADEAPKQPENAFDASTQEAQARDPSTGRFVSVTLGAEPHPDDEDALDGDRGDVIEDEAPPPKADNPEVVTDENNPEVVTKDEKAEAKDEEAKDEEAKDEEAKDEEAKDEGRSRVVDRRRFDDVNERRKRAEARVAALESHLASLTKAEAGAFDFQKAETEYVELLLDGKADEAARKRIEIDEARQVAVYKQARIEALQDAQVTTTEEALRDMTQAAAEAFGEFDPKSERYSEELCEQVEALYIGLQSRAKDPLSPVAALQKAIDTVVKANGLLQEEEEAPPPKARRPQPTVQQRMQQARQQPPVTTARVGKPADAAGTLARIEPTRLSDRDLERLEREDPDEYARLRGDVIE